MSKKSLNDNLSKESTERRKVGRPRKKPLTTESAEAGPVEEQEEPLDDSNKMLNPITVTEHVLDDTQLVVNSKQLTEMQTMVENIGSSSSDREMVDDNHLNSLDQGPDTVLMNDDTSLGAVACSNTTYVEFGTLPDELQLDGGGVEHNYSETSTEAVASAVVLPCKVVGKASEDDSQVRVAASSFSVGWGSIP